MADDEMQQLKARVAELETLLKARSEVPAITADEMATFHKVSQALNFDIGDCGINECFRPPVRCAVRCIRRCVTRCIFECSCGPCNIDLIGGGGFARFEEFGG